MLYGLPKVHKVNVPLRPTLSALDTHTYNLAKYLVSYLCEISVGQYTITDTFSFVEELHNLDLDTNKVFMASFNISSRFTNILISETIDIIISSSLLPYNFRASHMHNLGNFFILRLKIVTFFLMAISTNKLVRP